MHLQPFSALCVGWISTGLELGETRASVGTEQRSGDNIIINPGIVGLSSQTATPLARPPVCRRTDMQFSDPGVVE
ncbi:hypothetical protein ILYODFUR_003101 [Ilyodon furcidens]|uniref:Secreted protein n=1 Tax=Ilyodon furcidens TaxID=33524 RepID=A0ABV0UCZ5_9TELE